MNTGLENFEQYAAGLAKRFGLSATPLGQIEHFAANVIRMSFANIGVSTFHISPYKSEATRSGLSKAQISESYNMLIFDPCLVLLDQEGEATELSSGGVAVLDTRRTGYSWFPQSVSGSLLTIPVEIWHRMAPMPDPAGPYVLQMDRASTKIMYQMAKQIIDEGKQLPERFHDTIQRQLIELAGLCLTDISTGLPDSVIKISKIRKVKSLLETTLAIQLLVQALLQTNWACQNELYHSYLVMKSFLLLNLFSMCI